MQAACLAVRAKAVQAAIADARSPLFGAAAEDIDAADGRLLVKSEPARRETYATIAARHGPIEAEATCSPDADARNDFRCTPSAPCSPRSPSIPTSASSACAAALGVYGAGRIINPRAGRSQCTGGMVGGIGMALMEHTVLDPRDGRLVNADWPTISCP